MDYKKINEQTKDLLALRYSKKPVNRRVVNEIADDGYGSQGDSNEIYEVYEIGEDIFIELKIGSDSYGDNERVTGFRFVKPIKKTIIAYDYE